MPEMCAELKGGFILKPVKVSTHPLLSLECLSLFSQSRNGDLLVFVIFYLFSDCESLSPLCAEHSSCLAHFCVHVHPCVCVCEHVCTGSTGSKPLQSYGQN